MTLASLLAFAAATVSPWSPLASQWSPPAAISECPAVSAPRVVFPSNSPSHATGAGAVVWSASKRCPGGEDARVAPIEAGGVPGTSVIPRTAVGQALALQGTLQATGAPHGQLAIAGSTPGRSTNALLIQGGAHGPFTAFTPVEGSTAPMALTTAYLGDVAFAAPPAGASRSGQPNGLRVHVERFYSRSFGHSVIVDDPAGGPVRALTLALDYRSEALAVWAQAGAIYACVIPNSGQARPVQRIGAVSGTPQIAALLSDDNRAIVAWSQKRGRQTSVYLDRSAIGERFGAAQLLERFRDPDGRPPPVASPSLVRLSSEGVMIAWAGAAGGHWVVRSAPIDLNGIGLVSTIAAAGRDALLADLAAGPADDALLMWTEPSTETPGTPETQSEALFGAQTFGASPRRAVFSGGELIALGQRIVGADAGFDPDSDRAIVAWWGAAGAIEYSIRASSMTR